MKNILLLNGINFENISREINSNMSTLSVIAKIIGIIIIIYMIILIISAIFNIIKNNRIKKIYQKVCDIEEKIDYLIEKTNKKEKARLLNKKDKK
ncbi:MAG: hypothetical protein QXW97_02190 [Candidatus Pacearchaeota archaeon]